MISQMISQPIIPNIIIAEYSNKIHVPIKKAQLTSDNWQPITLDDG